MNTKIISLGLFALLSLVLVVSLASAISFTPDPAILTQPSNVSHSTGSFVVTFNVSNSATAGSANFSYVATSGVSTATFSPSALTLAAGPTSGVVTATISFPANQAGNVAGTITVYDTSNQASPKTIAVSVPILSSKVLTTSSVTSPTRITNGSVTLKNDGNTALTLIPSSSGSFNVSLYKSGTAQSTISLSAGASDTFTVVPVNLPSLSFGTKTSTLTLTDSANAISQTVSFSFLDSFCSNGPAGTNLSITDFNVESSGSDDNEWKPLDTITVKVEIENVGPTKVRDIVVEIGLIDSAGKDQIGQVEFSDSDEEKKDLSDLSDGDNDEVTFEFLVPADFDDGDYKLVAKAYSTQEKETNICADSSSDMSNGNYESINVIREDDQGKYIAFDNIALSPSEATCGDTITLDFDVINVGEEDQDQVKVNVKSTALGIDTSSEIKDNLDIGDDKALSFAFTLPQGLQDKTYVIELTSEYDYKSSSDTYRESSEEAKSVYLKVFGCSGVSTPSSNKIVVSADLDSDAEAGKPLVVKTTITNNKGSAGVFSVSASGYDSWASLDSVSDRIVSLNAGQSKDVTLTFNVDSSAKGEQSFVLEVKADSGEVQQKEIVADVAAKQGFSLSGSLGGNGVIWAIGIINVILIILIIVVAVKLSNR